ncbi:peptidyl-prolyl cis-trans isomerase [bacterium]|nr:peptidyl-prolyl cis-trans isomerase [bacterium]
MNQCKKFILFYITIVFCLGLFACKGENGDNEIIAKVGNVNLSREEMRARMEWEGMRPEQESEFIDRWINRELLSQEAKRLGLDKSESAELLMELGMVEKEYLIQKLLDKTYAQSIQITEEEIQSYYDKNIDLFCVNEDQVRVMHILTETKEEADLALQEIRAGKPFDQVARERSIGILRERGGDMGFIRREDVINQVERVAFGTKEGGVSAVFESDYGFHIVKVIKKLSAGEAKDLADVRSEILQQLQVRKERSVYYDLLFRLQNSTEVQINVPKDVQESRDSVDVSIVP